MKKSFLIITFVTQIVSTAFGSTALDTNNSVSLIPENKIAFASFIEKNAPMFYQIESDNWKNFQKVVTFYNVSTSELLKMSETERRNFLISSKALVKELQVMNSIDSKKWVNHIESTTAIIKFTWGVQEVPVNIEFEAAPSNVEQPVTIDTNFLGK